MKIAEYKFLSVVHKWEISKNINYYLSTLVLLSVPIALVGPSMSTVINSFLQIIYEMLEVLSHFLKCLILFSLTEGK